MIGVSQRSQLLPSESFNGTDVLQHYNMEWQDDVVSMEMWSSVFERILVRCEKCTFAWSLGVTHILRISLIIHFGLFIRGMNLLGSMQMCKLCVFRCLNALCKGFQVFLDLSNTKYPIFLSECHKPWKTWSITSFHHIGFYYIIIIGPVCNFFELYIDRNAI